ncbi:MAG: Uma2 family endonuclease [Dechloromonas sp.]|nr:Uma2 family endonuclease [Dechloromonas sp.]
MSLPQTASRFDVESYLAWEETQAERHEYLAGEVFAMSGGSDAHYTITLNLAANLKSALSGTPCRPFVSGMKVRIAATDAVLYPDVFVTCDSRDKTPEAALAKAHPVLVTEVLSDSTAAYDRGRKFELYQKIPELQEYLILEQDRLHADLFRKNEAGLWVMHPAGEGDTIELTSVGLRLPLADLYADVDFDAAA